MREYTRRFYVELRGSELNKLRAWKWADIYDGERLDKHNANNSTFNKQVVSSQVAFYTHVG